MQTSRPPTIPASVNSDSSYTRTLQVNTLQVDGSVTGSMTVPTLTVQDDVSFFGTPLVGQQTVYPTIGSIIQALQTFGLAAPGYNQEAGPLVGTEAIGASKQGSMVALSTDGNTLAVGGDQDDGYIGAVWIYTKNQGVWTQQGSKLVGTGNVGGSHQGWAVALSADGNTLASGAYSDNNYRGAVWIFTRTDGVWSQQGSKLVGTGVADVGFGNSVSFSADGNTLAVGEPGDNSGIGAVWVFTRTDGVWSQQSKLVGTGYVGPGFKEQGRSVSLSVDGNTLAFGGPSDNNYVGATWVFVRTGGFGGTWSQQGSKLVGSGGIGGQVQGNSVALRGDTLVVGGFADNDVIGATWVFSRSGTTWTQVGEKLIGTGYVGPDVYQGASVSLSDDEQTFITAGPYDNDFIGAVWVFRLVDGVWTQYNEKLVPTGYTGWPGFGYEINAIAISGDSTTIAIGGSYNDNVTGAAWIYVG